MHFLKNFHTLKLWISAGTHIHTYIIKIKYIKEHVQVVLCINYISKWEIKMALMDEMRIEKEE